MPPAEWDTVVVGAGPAGTACAGILASHGARVLVLEKSGFPREKVCGDCLNPRCHSLFAKLGIAGDIAAAEQGTARFVSFVSPANRTVSVALPFPEAVIARSQFDAILARRAADLGAELAFGCAVHKVECLGENSTRWRVHSGGAVHTSRFLIAADGRNSTVARLLGILPPAKRARLALQSQLPHIPKFRETIQLTILSAGYVGIAPVGGGRMNVCLVSRPQNLGTIRAWADQNLGSDASTQWNSLAPLDRSPVSPAPPDFPGLALLGDAARVVEPFTGEGIYYALKTGELAAEAILSNDLAPYRKAHARLYRGRLWLNRVARIAVTHPGIGGSLVALGALFPSLFSALTRKVTAPSTSLMP